MLIKLMFLRIPLNSTRSVCGPSPTNLQNVLISFVTNVTECDSFGMAVLNKLILYSWCITGWPYWLVIKSFPRLKN